MGKKGRVAFFAMVTQHGVHSAKCGREHAVSSTAHANAVDAERGVEGRAQRVPLARKVRALTPTENGNDKQPTAGRA